MCEELRPVRSFPDSLIYKTALEPGYLKKVFFFHIPDENMLIYFANDVKPIFNQRLLETPGLVSVKIAFTRKYRYDIIKGAIV